VSLRLGSVLAVLAALVLAFAACGGGGGDSASSSTDVNQLLKDTFSGDKQIKSGKLSLSLRVESTGGSSSTQGPVSISLSGPFESQGDGKLPKLAFDAKLEGAGQNISAGVTSTGDKGFVSFQGTDYALSDTVFAEFKKGFEQAQAQASEQEGQSLATLGIDPRRWLKNPKNAGEAKVGDDDAIRITGDVDVPKLLDDVNSALQKARGLGVQGSESLPEKLTDAQKKQVTDAIDRLAVEIYTGKDDQILRRIVVDLGVDAAASGSTAAQKGSLKLDLQFTDVNQGQDISEPENAKPFDELLGQLGGLGALGGGASSGSSGGSGSGATGEDLQKYSECIKAAGDDADKARDCADILTP
jgi:hypothetical protein